MTISPFRERYKHEPRTEILRLAREEFVHEKGYAGSSMRRVAEQVGGVPSAIQALCEQREISDCLVEESFARFNASARERQISPRRRPDQSHQARHEGLRSFWAGEPGRLPTRFRHSASGKQSPSSTQLRVRRTEEQNRQMHCRGVFRQRRYGPDRAVALGTCARHYVSHHPKPLFP